MQKIRKIKIKLGALLILAMLAISMNGFAGTTEERVYLIQILNQLNAIKPLIVSAAREQPKTNRIQFHYIAYRDANGKPHNGLLNDINEIEKGIKEKLNHTPSEPRVVRPISGDYIDHSKNNRSASAW